MGAVDLGITGLAVAVGPYGTHFARLQKLRLGEQDPVLFGIPSDYHIVDVKLPDPGK